jgi:RNA polymerase sigma-70 factor, ECF subfamily
MGADHERLFVNQLEALRRFVRLLVRDDDTANELLQDLAVIVLEHPSGPRDLASFPLWCRGIARHLTLHRRRAFARLATCIETLEMFETHPAVDDLERSMIARQELVAGLQALDESSQQLLFEYFFDGASSTELAARRNVSPAAIRMRLTRLRTEVRSAAEREQTSPLRLASRGNAVNEGGSPPRDKV